ncbi:MAG: hypothetical protein LBH61_03275 [Dysgonamonadaceae bacterium]|jgi:hypothetical protein|nr:hypothetical protein [Dysgonamonadaceae bacterium]
MKTLDTAAAEYANNTVELVNEPHKVKCRNSFIAGVKWAQEWIPVETTPTENRTYLIKDKNNMIGLASWCGYWDYKFAKTITHYRPINRF